VNYSTALLLLVILLCCVLMRIEDVKPFNDRSEQNFLIQCVFICEDDRRVLRESLMLQQPIFWMSFRHRSDLKLGVCGFVGIHNSLRRASY
jgi:hypothetical protein